MNKPVPVPDLTQHELFALSVAARLVASDPTEMNALFDDDSDREALRSALEKIEAVI